MAINFNHSTETITTGTNVLGFNSMTGALILPSSTTGNRPGSPTNGMIRYNSDLSAVEIYNSGWSSVALASATQDNSLVYSIVFGS